MKEPIFKSIAFLIPMLTLSISSFEKAFRVDSSFLLRSGFVIAVAISVVGVIYEWIDYSRRRPKKYTQNHPDIKQYMRDWLNKGGRCLILSRDLSWVSRKELTILEGKSRANELELIVGTSRNETVDNLKNLGAIVHDYSKFDAFPKSRFTIINYGRNGEQIAIGKSIGDKHIITEHSRNDDDIFLLATDLKAALVAACSNG